MEPLKDFTLHLLLCSSRVCERPFFMENMNKGWLKLHRKLQDSQMYRALNSKQRDVMMQCLMLANHTENQWEWGKGIYTCQPGQFITSLQNIAQKCGKDVKVQSVRTSLLKLEEWHFLTNKSTKTGRLITILNWDTYQNPEDATNKEANKQLTKSQQRANKELTTNKNVKNEKNVKNKEGVVDFPSNLNTPEFKKVWEDWVCYRAEMKKKLTSSTVKSQLKKLSEYTTTEAIATIEKSIQNGWQGLFPEKNPTPKTKTPKTCFVCKKIATKELTRSGRTKGICDNCLVLLNAAPPTKTFKNKPIPKKYNNFSKLEEMILEQKAKRD